MNISSILSSQKKWYALFVIFLIFTGVAFLIWFFIPTLFVDEFYPIQVVYRDERIDMENVDQLREKRLSRFTSVSSTWKNQGVSDCEVEVRSSTLQEKFSLAPLDEFGLILPKGEVVYFRMCDKEGKIDLGNL